MTKKRARRVFDAAFKMEALRRLDEQLALKTPMSNFTLLPTGDLLIETAAPPLHSTRS